MNDIRIRPVEPADNPFLATIIRNTLSEFGLARPGTAYYDEATNNMYTCFQLAGSRYYAGLLDNRIVGGGGIYPSPGLPAGVCELVKMYLSSAARGYGLGKALLETCL